MGKVSQEMECPFEIRQRLSNRFDRRFLRFHEGYITHQKQGGACNGKRERKTFYGCQGLIKTRIVRIEQATKALDPLI